MVARTEFKATNVSTRDAEGVSFIGFANATGEYILFQRSVCPSAQDINLGHDQVYVEVNDQNHSTYGGVADHTLTSRKLIVRLTSQVAQKIGTEPTLEVTFDVSDEQFRVLKAVLEQLFAKHPLSGQEANRGVFDLLKKLTHTSINWQKTSESPYLFESSLDGTVVRLRLNDFPEKALCTVVIGEAEIDIDEFPESWTLPRHRGEKH